MSWGKVKIENLCSLLSGNAWSASKFKDEGILPIIRIQNLGNNVNEKFIWWNETYDKRFVVTKGDILLSLSGSIKVDVWNGKPGLLNQRIVKLSPKEGVDKRWFYWQINSIILEIEKMGKWALVNNVSISDLKDLEIPLPPLRTQKRIADILDAADALRQKDQELLKKYDELAQAIFIDMFGDPEKNEKGWEITDLKNIVHQDRIVTYGIVQAGQHIDDGIPYIRTGDIKNGEILVNQLQKTSIEIAESYNRSKLYLNDIIMSIRATVGTVALLPDSLIGANLTQGTARISPSDKVNRLYLYYFLKNDFAQNWINENSKGATFREITLTKLRDLPILLPPLKLQNQFGDLMSNLLSNNTLLKNQISMSRDFFQSLLQKAFNGELVA